MMIRGQFTDFFLDTMKPAIDHVIWGKFNQRPPFWSRIFQVRTSNRGIEQTSQISGVGLFASINEGGSVRFDQPVQGFDKTYTHVRYGLGFKTSQDLVEDDKIGLVARMSRELGRSCQETLEIAVAAHFNNAFVTAGPDAVSLCNAAHPLVKSGGTQSNILAVAADLDVTSLQLALTDFETQVDSSGKKIRVPARKLVVAPANRWMAYQVTKSPMQPDTANNAVNALKYAETGMPEPFVWPYLTDTDAWFLVADPDETELLFFWRRKPYTRHWIDDNSETGLSAMRYKCSSGFSDYVGVYGTPGA